MMPTAPTRFLGNTSKNFQQFINGAETYVANLDPTAKTYLFQKPFDGSPGAVYFHAIYQTTNLIQTLALPIGSRIAEVGSGPGWLTEMLVGLGYEVWAIEPAADMIATARERLASFMEHRRFPQPCKVKFFC